ncbi:MAG: BMP family ABC transporter substrate-binding protein [Firmicutes bacterium]|nr:BMP family ABC transporter substrate-binding protein [Bacillota bacterium]
MKKVLALVLALCMVLGLAACGGSSSGSTTTTTEKTVYKVGMVCIGDANQAYDRNFMMAADEATARLAAKGIDIEWIYKYNNPTEVADDTADLADEGCIAVFCNSYGQEPQMLITAQDYPDTVFAGLTNQGSQADELPNTINAFPNIFEARYLAGVAAGCKLQEMIDNGTIKADEAVMGYVGAFTYSEVISGYTAFFLGAQSICPTATMLVEFIGSWGDTALEAAAAQDLIDKGAVLISQHSDNTSPATTAQANGKYHVGYNIAMSDVAPEASIISSRIDWTNFFESTIETIVNGGEVPQDYLNHGLADGDVTLTDLNTAIAAPGTQEAIDKAAAAIKSGELQVFDTSKFTVGGETITSALADTDGDFAGDTEAVFDGYFHESYLLSAPQFGVRIDGITLVNEEY